MGDICRRFGKDAETLTFSQFFLYVKAAGKDRLQEFKEQAMAARVAQATQDGWQQFMESLEKGAGDDVVDRLEQIDKAVPESNMDEDEVTWQKFNSK